MFRHVRLAVSVAFLSLFVVTACLWVRNQQTKDILWIHQDAAEYLRLASHDGRIVVSSRSLDRISEPWWLSHARVTGRVYQDDFGKTPSNWWFQILKWNGGLREFHLPLWMPLLVFASLALAVSPKRQFSLRTLLIAVTIFAVLLAIAGNWHPEIPNTHLLAAG